LLLLGAGQCVAGDLVRVRLRLGGSVVFPAVSPIGRVALGPALSQFAFGDFDGDGMTGVFASICP
jgi:hypothetical protein